MTLTIKQGVKKSATAKIMETTAAPARPHKPAIAAVISGKMAVFHKSISFGPGAAETMRKGFSPQVMIDTAGALGLPRDKFYESLRLPKSTMEARIADKKHLNGPETDRLFRLHRVVMRAMKVLDDDNAATQWVQRPNRALGGVTPMSLLDTEIGYEQVLDSLGRIEAGVF